MEQVVRKSSESEDDPVVLPPSISAPSISYVSVKLPAFWRDTAEVWFAQAEAQFVIRNVSLSKTKFHQFYPEEHRQNLPKEGDGPNPRILLYCFVYNNHILVFSPNLTSHVEHLRDVLELCCSHGLTICIKKCKFAIPQTELHAPPPPQYFWPPSSPQTQLHH